jgi:hypothetical protein
LDYCHFISIYAGKFGNIVKFWEKEGVLLLSGCRFCGAATAGYADDCAWLRGD